MKRKILVVLLSIVSVFCLAFALTACDKLGGLFGGGGGIGGGSFTLNNVKRIELGDYRYDVKNYLGEPDEGEEYGSTWVYYGSNYKSLMAQDEKLQEDLLNASSEKEVEDILKKLLELEESFTNLTYNYCTVTFDDDMVIKVEFDAKKSESGAYDSKTSKSISLSMDTVLLYTDLSGLDLTEKIEYTDGSYKLDKLPQSVISDINTAQLGDQNINWSDNWAEYTGKFNVSNTVTLSDNGIKYKMTVKDGSTAENCSVLMTVSGKGEMWDDKNVYSRFVTEIIVEKGITGVSMSGYWNVKKVTLSDSVKDFYGNVLEYIEVAANNSNYYSQDGILYNKAKTEILVVPTYVKGSVTIPEGVTEIGGIMFSSNTNLTDITIPSSVTSVGKDAFNGCTNLKTVTFGAGSKLSEIATRMFENCESLESIAIPDSVTSIGEFAFWGCNSLKTVTFGANSQLTSIYKNAFYQCRSLKTVTFGANSKLTSIGDQAFAGCTSLENIEFTKLSKLTSIGDRAFESCWEFTSVVLPDSVTSIGNYAFSSCASLESITLSKNITTIGSYAFQKCSFKSIVIPSSSVTSIGYNVFKECSNLRTIYYGGTAETWSGLLSDTDKNNLKYKTIYYYSESDPGENAGNFWHYVDGEAVAW